MLYIKTTAELRTRWTSKAFEQLHVSSLSQSINLTSSAKTHSLCSNLSVCWHKRHRKSTDNRLTAWDSESIDTDMTVSPPSQTMHTNYYAPRYAHTHTHTHTYTSYPDSIINSINIIRGLTELLIFRSFTNSETSQHLPPWMKDKMYETKKWCTTKELSKELTHKKVTMYWLRWHYYVKDIAGAP